MKTIRNLMTLAGFSLVLFALGAIGARAQEAPSLEITNFSGTFTLPAEAQWGRATLPAGNYTLYYGSQQVGSKMVEVLGESNDQHSIIPIQSPSSASTGKNMLICVREGDTLIVRALEMPGIGKSVNFAMPHGARLVAHKGKHSGYTQLAEAPVLIQRIPVTLNAK